MKKILSTILALSLALSVTACSAKPQSSSSTPATPPTSNSPAADASVSLPTSAPQNTPDAGFPMVYTPKLTAGAANIVKNENDVYYDESVGTTVEYTAMARQLESIYKEQEIIWPELNDEWKGYNYIAITNTDMISSRTMDIGQYKGKGDKVIAEHINWLKGIAGDYKIIEAEKVEDGKLAVPYSYLEYGKTLTAKEFAGIAYEAFYLQTWSLVPAAEQGVCIKTPDGIFTAEAIINMPRG